MAWWKKYLDKELEEFAYYGTEKKQQNLDAKLHKAYLAYEVKFWLEAGANPNALDERGRTKLMKTDNVEIINLLLEAGAKADIIEDRENNDVSHSINPEIYQLSQNETTDMDEIRDSDIPLKLNDMFMDAQEKIKTKSNEKRMAEMAQHKYAYLLDNISPEKAEKLEKLVQSINASIFINRNETDSLEQLRGMSLNDIESDVISASTEKAALQYVEEGGVEGLKLLAKRHQDTPAYDLLLDKYCDRYSYSKVKYIIEPYVESRALQQDFLFILSNLDPKYIEKHEQDLRNLDIHQSKKILEAAKEKNFYAKKFAEVYDYLCDKLLIQCESEQRNTTLSGSEYRIYFDTHILPVYKEKCEQLWQKMINNKDAYVSDKPLQNHDEGYGSLSEEKIEQAKAVFEDKEKTISPIQRAVIQAIAKRKILAAVRYNSYYTNAPFLSEMYYSGITTYTQARRVVNLYWQLNKRPSKYHSSYNDYSIGRIARVVQKFNLSEKASWMYPILIDAADERRLYLASKRQPSEQSLFDACRAWKVCSQMPLRLAKKVGRYSLSGRIVAGAVFDKLSKEKKLETADWASNKELQTDFYATLSRYFKMDRNEALKQLSNFIGKGNRKRLLYNALENQGFLSEDYRFESLLESYRTDENIGDIVQYCPTVARKGRFANKEEFEYALEHFDKKTLADSMIFRAQQRVMNVLVSTSAQQDYNFSKEEAEAFRKPNAPKSIASYIGNNYDWLLPASFKSAVIFKDYFPAYIKTIQNYNKKNRDNALSIHDAVYWLPEPMNKEANERFAQFIQKNIIYQNSEHKMVHRPLNELSIIAKNWKALENKLHNQNCNTEIAKLKYNDVLSICMSVQYEDQRNELFAIEAAKHGTPEEEYHNCEDIYLAGLKVPEPFNSKKLFKEGKYTGRFLQRDDPRTIFFGDYTNCCQHYGGVGHDCAVSTVKEPFSQLFVIEDREGKIIAGSWTWENTEGKYRDVCFDNIEALGELMSRPEINKIYEQVGEYLTKDENCHKVTIGLGYQDADISKYEATEAIPLPKLYGNGYSDAHSQVLLAENPNAKPLDKTQESQRYIRDVCFLDMEAMDRVSETVFPDGDKQLQAPDNMAGFVIEDREKGVVGYCLYEQRGDNEYYISDTAVLEEYRLDKNASSKKLFAELMRCVREKGGNWYAEMREETSLRYLKAMAARGIVKYEILNDNDARDVGLDCARKMEYDSKIKAASTVYPVRFEFVRDDVRQALNKLKEHIDAGKETDIPTVSLQPVQSDSKQQGEVVSKIKQNVYENH